MICACVLSFIFRHGFAAWRNEPNELAGVSYGEFPLSFAAAVGDEHVCYLLYKRAQELLRSAVYVEIVDDGHSIQQGKRITGGVGSYLKSQLDKWIVRNISMGDEILTLLQEQVRLAVYNKILMPMKSHIYSMHVLVLYARTGLHACDSLFAQSASTFKCASIRVLERMSVTGRSLI
jgi:hypothetical protein